MKISKFTAAVALMTAVSLTLLAASGCGGNKNADETTTTPVSDETEETTADGTVDDTTDITDNTETSPDGGKEETTNAQNVPSSEKTTEKETKNVNETTSANTAGSTSNTTNTDAIPAKSEFDILTGSSFYIVGTSIDSSNAKTDLELARTDTSIYMSSDMDGIPMGALIKDDTAYMICDSKKIYLEITSSIRKAMNLDDSQFPSPADYTYADLGSLKDADSVEKNADFRGTSCTAYTFTRENSKLTAYMNGTKLLGYMTVNLDGSDPSTIVISKITSDIPDGKKNPPSDYKAYKGVVGALRFATAIGIEE